ncbi:hypothetical protein BDW74DRAFT_182251 [Aspergillus multicolor]|uniref:nucleic acid/nucleotide deaminase domain-containing protein n=1 Tax=Aspergillus multicolor TaxID=41759 RepID=UPI003CCCD646
MSNQSHLQMAEAPVALKAMLFGSENLKDEETRLYEYLNLLHCLDEFQGKDRVDHEDKKAGVKRHTAKEMRRSFLDGVAYLCDVDPKGGTVTAGALRKYYPKRRSQDVKAVLYLAANEPIINNLHDKNFLSGFALPERLERNKTIVTRVHAELQIVDYFSRKKLESVDDDKYVGCSKPACYFCYLWIKYHRGGFVIAAAHKKIILGCRGPGVDVTEDPNGNGANIRKGLYELLTREVVRDIEEQVRSEGVTSAPRHLSSNGSSRALSIMTRPPMLS